MPSVNIFVSDCEHLIRRMLVRDPEKRYTVEQIKKHRWLLADGPLKPINSLPAFHTNTADITNGSSNPDECYNEQVLRLMDQIGIERQKTIEVIAFQCPRVEYYSSPLFCFPVYSSFYSTLFT